MGDETSDTMSLDLNLCPAPEPAVGSASNEPMNLDDRIDDPVDRWSETMRFRAPQWRRWGQLHIIPRSQGVSMEVNQLLVNSGNGSMLQVGEGSVAAEGSTEVVPKTCDNTGVTVDEASVEKEDIEKGDINDGSFFDCNICLYLAKDPVVTCCGHLFCWPCLYRWLHVHSDAKECPVCKGEVASKNVTPIYGRGNNTLEPEEGPSLKIPRRPQARRVESLRQTIQRNASAPHVEEMIRRLRNRIDLRGVVQHNELDVRESAERTTSLLNRFLTSRGLRREQNLGAGLDEVVGLTQSSPGDNHRVQSVFPRRMHAERANPLSLTSALNSAERLVEAYVRNHQIGRNQEQTPTVDDRDSFSSIGAVINSESQMDTALEIDSLVSLSTSSSRRRTNASRVSDVDTGDSRAPRRRRLS